MILSIAVGTLLKTWSRCMQTCVSTNGACDTWSQTGLNIATVSSQYTCLVWLSNYVAYQLILSAMCDVELISNYTCPVCHVQCGRSQSDRRKRRHSLVMHLRRGKEKDLQHAVWTAAHYRKHFPIGRTQPKVVTLSVNQVEKIIRQHCGDGIVERLQQSACS